MGILVNYSTTMLYPPEIMSLCMKCMMQSLLIDCLSMFLGVLVLER